MHATACPDIGPICATRDEPPQLHDQDFTLGEIRLRGAYGIRDWLGVELQLPFKISGTAVDYRRLDGSAFDPDYQDIHHRDEVLAGLGDPWLLARFTLFPGLSVAIGPSLPLGRTEANPFALGDMGLAHQHVQFGTGTLDLVAVLDLRYPIGARVAVRAYGQAQAIFYENGHGYRAGNRYAVGSQAELTPSERLGFGIGLDLVNEQPERWDGQVLQDGNLGRTDLLLGASASVQLGRYRVMGGVKVPVYQHIISAGDEHAQLTYPAIVELGVQGRFDVGP